MTLDLQKMHTTTKAKHDRIPEGSYMGRTASIVDLGIQPQTDWKTQEPSASKPRLLITWELPTETIKVEHEDGTTEELPRLISKEFTASAHEKANLTKLLKELAIQGFGDLIDMPCMISVGSTSNGNAKILSVIRAPKGMTVDALSRKAAMFDFDVPTEDVFLSQPQWIQQKIKDAENYLGFADNWASDEIPF